MLIGRVAAVGSDRVLQISLQSPRDSRGSDGRERDGRDSRGTDGRDGRSSGGSGRAWRISLATS